jgi:hypothetical protein
MIITCSRSITLGSRVWFANKGRKRAQKVKEGHGKMKKEKKASL